MVELQATEDIGFFCFTEIYFDIILAKKKVIDGAKEELRKKLEK